MQTHEWEALLDGTTEGQWTGIADEDTTCITTPDGVLIDVDEHWSSCSEADVRLAAYAPAAVAEVVRLRREVAAFRDQMTKSAERYKSFYDGGDDTKHLEDADYDRQIANVLTRILNGDTSES